MSATKTPATARTVPGRGQPNEVVDVENPTCVVEDCDRRQHAHRMCGMHAQRQARWGSPFGSAPRQSVADRFWSKVDKTETCWLWTATKNPNGYGMFKPADNRPEYAHRVGWTLTRGPIPDGLQLDHLCRVRACVNPEHLEPVTQAENIRRAFAVRAALEAQATMAAEVVA